MSFKLADGSLNTDYKVGDEFVDQFGKSLLLINDDRNNSAGTGCFKLKCMGGFSFYRAWIGLTPAKKEAGVEFTDSRGKSLQVGDFIKVKSLKGYPYFGHFKKGDYGRVKYIDRYGAYLEGDTLGHGFTVHRLKVIKIKGIK